jgi:hypothetical protein
MDNVSHQDGSNTQLYDGLSSVLQIFDSIENWLAGLFEWTEEAGEDAALRLDDQHQR